MWKWPYSAKDVKVTKLSLWQREKRYTKKDEILKSPTSGCLEWYN